MPISPTQVKAARELLGWSHEHLAREAALGKSALVLFERGESLLANVHLDVLREALEYAGVRFLADGVVVLSKREAGQRARRR